METVSDINGKFKIFQRKDSFRFGTDAVLLAHFARVKKKEVLFDLCSGTGAVGFFCHLLYQPKQIGFVEIDPVMSALSQKTASENQISDRCEFYCCDLKDFSAGKYSSNVDCITVNPPYFFKDSGKTNANPKLTGARHTRDFSNEILFQKACELLKDGGKLFLIQRTQNLAELISRMREAHLEPKRLRLVHSYPHKEASLFLLEAVKNGGVWLDCMAPLILYEKEGVPTGEFRQMSEF